MAKKGRKKVPVPMHERPVYANYQPVSDEFRITQSPAIALDPAGQSQRTRFRWTTIHVDCGEWAFAFGSVDRKTILQQILPALQEREEWTWAQVEQHADGGSHGIKISTIIREAQRRIEKIGIGNETSLFSLRLDGKKRVWGVRERNLLRVLWWDPMHEICPSHKKHT